MITTGATLAIFLILGISSLSLFWAKRLNIPHTVLLVFVGTILGLASSLEPFSFLHEFKLTPELLFYLLLPTLIFESAYNMSVRKLVADGGAIISLAIGGFLISMTVIAFLLQFLLSLIGLTVPFVITLLFGALISATDPVAVLALFKEYGVPRRLSLIFEGESLFNDATAVAAFLIILEAISQGGMTLLSSLSGLFSFFSMLVLGVIFGLFTGSLFSYLVGKTRKNEVASITLTIVLAHITFIMAEVLSDTSIFGLFSIHISPIISTTVASLLMGNYGRTKLNPQAEVFVEKLWEQFAFMANSLIFILIGILIVETPILNSDVFMAVVLSIITVAIARAVSVYPIIYIYNLFKERTQSIPRTWQHLMAWGSLRGALAVTMVLLITDDLTVPGWNLAIDPRTFLLSITIGCIAATLFIKATTIKTLVRKFKLDDLTAVEEVEYQEAQALVHHKVSHELKKYEDRGYVNQNISHDLQSVHDSAFKEACDKVSALSDEKKHDLALRVLRIFAIGIEKRHLKILYDHKEITESVFRRIQGKLRLQLEAVENGNLSPDTTIHVDARDIFDSLFNTLKRIFSQHNTDNYFTNRYMYYRAQAIISRKVLKELKQLETVSNTIFTREAVSHINNLYKSFKDSSLKKLQNLSQENKKMAHELSTKLAEHSVKTIEASVIEDIYHKELITPKLYILLKKELAID